MKSLFNILYLATCLIAIAACGTSKSVGTNSAPNPNVIENPGASLSRTDRLKTIAGVSVIGYGGGAKIRIRANNSIVADTEPLFILDDQIVNGGYSAVFGLVDVANIKRITVLKDSSSTSEYGIRGANGVIKIELL